MPASQTQIQKTAAKLIACDKHFAAEDETESWDAKFVMSMMDWVFVTQNPMTVKQLNKVEEVYSRHDEDMLKDFSEFLDDPRIQYVKS